MRRTQSTATKSETHTSLPAGQGNFALMGGCWGREEAVSWTGAHCEHSLKHTLLALTKHLPLLKTFGLKKAELQENVTGATPQGKAVDCKSQAQGSPLLAPVV